MLEEGLAGLGYFAGYFVFTGSLALVIKKFTNVKTELFRKTLHIICVMSVLVLLSAFDAWYLAALTELAFVAAVYPLLKLLERLPIYNRVLPQRKDGEFKSSLVLVFAMFIILTAVFWGWLGEGNKYVIVVAVMSWGYGDAAAALVGKTFGRRHVENRLVEGRKTVEGAAAMFAVAWIAAFATLLIYNVLPWHLCIVVATVVAPVCSVVELFSRGGSDTITVPLSAAAVTYAAVSLVTILAR